MVRFLVFEKDDPLGLVISAPSLVPPPENGHMQPFDARTGEFFDALPPPGGFMYLMLKLHTDLFLGLPGYLFLGLMGLLLVASLVSGVVVYTPFMRKLDFATVRAERSRRLKWLDLHNLLGIVTLSWVLVVGVTGVINTLALPILMLWQGGQLAEMTAPYKDAPPLQRLARSTRPWPRHAGRRRTWRSASSASPAPSSAASITMRCSCAATRRSPSAC